MVISATLPVAAKSVNLFNRVNRQFTQHQRLEQSAKGDKMHNQAHHASHEHHSVLHTMTQGLSDLFKRFNNQLQFRATVGGSKFALKTAEVQATPRAKAA